VEHRRRYCKGSAAKMKISLIKQKGSRF